MASTSTTDAITALAQPDKEELREFLKWTEALMRAMDAAVLVDDPNGLWKHSGFKQYARKYNDLLTLVSAKLRLPPVLDVYKLDAIPGNADSLPFQRKEIFDGVYANLSLLRATLENELGVVEDETDALRNFLQARLRSAVLHEPTRELDIQDAVETLLIGRGMQKGIDYDREVGRVKVSVKEVIPDFIVPPLALALEVKLIKPSTRVRGIVDEMNADIQAYSKRYRTILFLVYDMGNIRDETEFKQDLEDAEKVLVVVIKH